MAQERIQVIVTGDSDDLRRALREARDELKDTERQTQVSTKRSEGFLAGFRRSLRETLQTKGRVEVDADTGAATARLGALQAAIADIEREVPLEVDADTAVAQSQLRILRADAKRTADELAMEGMRSRGLIAFRDDADAAASSARGASSGFRLFGLSVAQIGTRIAVASPFVVSFGASIAALVASASAAALGLGALGVASVGALGAFGALAAGARRRYTEMKDEGGSAANSLSESFSQLGKTFDRATASGADSAMSGLARGLRELRPTVASLREPFAQLGEASGSAFERLGRAIRGPEIRSGLQALVSESSKLAGPVASGVSSLLRIFLNLANKAMPTLIDGSRSLAAWLERVADSSRNWDLSGVMGQLRSWLTLGREIGRVFIEFFRVTAADGKGLVDTLAQGAKNLADWIKANPERISDFFDRVIPLAGETVKLIGNLGGLFLKLAEVAAPPLTKLLKIVNKLASSDVGQALIIGAGVVAGLSRVLGLLSKIAAIRMGGGLLGTLLGGGAAGGGAGGGLAGIAGVLRGALGKAGLAGVVALGVDAGEDLVQGIAAGIRGDKGGVEAAFQDFKQSVDRWTFGIVTDVAKAFNLPLGEDSFAGFAKRYAEMLGLLPTGPLDRWASHVKRAARDAHEGFRDIGNAARDFGDFPVPKIPKIDTSSLETAGKNVRNAGNEVDKALNRFGGGKPPKIPKPDTSSLKGAASEVKNFGNEVDRALDRVGKGNKPVKLTAKLRDDVSGTAQKIANTMGKLDGEEATPLAKLRDQASSSIQKIGGAARQLGGFTATPGVRVDPGNALGVIGQVQRGLKDIGTTVANATVKVTRVPGGREQGGYVFAEGGAVPTRLSPGGGFFGSPGQQGRDEPVYGLGRGEAVLTTPQQSVVQGWAATAKAVGTSAMGSLGELFDRVRSPHWAGGFASGGVVDLPPDPAQFWREVRGLTDRGSPPRLSNPRNGPGNKGWVRSKLDQIRRPLEGLVPDDGGTYIADLRRHAGQMYGYYSMTGGGVDSGEEKALDRLERRVGRAEDTREKGARSAVNRFSRAIERAQNAMAETSSLKDRRAIEAEREKLEEKRDGWIETYRKAYLGLSDEGSSPSGDPYQSEVIAEMLRQTQATLRVSEAQFSVLRNFGPFIGQYAHGGEVRVNGVAGLHRGETVVPDPRGPYGSQLRSGAEPPITVLVTVEGDEGRFIKKIDARVERKAPSLVSQKLGERSRRIASAPGR